MGTSTVSIHPFRRWIPVIASIFIQMCLGTAYIWGVFQSHLIITPATPGSLFAWPATHGTLAYALLLLFLTFGSVAGGKIVQKTGKPGPVILSGGLVLGLGFFLSMFTREATPWVLWLSYGVLGGIGMGLAYTTTIGTCQKWFPDKKGLVTGIIVSALGFGGLVFTPVAELLIQRFGVLATFAILSILFVVVSVVGSLFIKNPPEGYQPNGWTPPVAKNGLAAYQYTPSETLKTSQFYLVTVALMLATAAGSMMIPMAKILGLQPDSGLTKEAAVLGVMIISACNSLGRLVWGGVSDRLGRKPTLMLLMALAGLAVLSITQVSGYWMLAFIALIGFSYGGFLGVFPALTADFWGSKYVATNYGLILLGFGVGAVASSFLVAYLSQTRNFSTAFLIAGIAATAGLVIMGLVKAPVHPDQVRIPVINAESQAVPE
jgi:OFA family oxalate/formate antiporter-like MFS transporter